jgi:hypothetical protein
VMASQIFGLRIDALSCIAKQHRCRVTGRRVRTQQTGRRCDVWAV